MNWNKEGLRNKSDSKNEWRNLTAVTDMEGCLLYTSCIEAVPVLNEAAKENGAVVYYVDTSKPENYSEAMIEKIMTLFEGWLLRDEEGEEGFYVPDVALIVNGRVAANHIATVDSHDPCFAPIDVYKRQEKAAFEQIVSGVDQLRTQVPDNPDATNEELIEYLESLPAKIAMLTQSKDALANYQILINEISDDTSLADQPLPEEITFILSQFKVDLTKITNYGEVKAALSNAVATIDQILSLIHISI